MPQSLHIITAPGEFTLRKDVPRPAPMHISTRGEFACLSVLHAIVLETMECSPISHKSSDSYLPPDLITEAQHALDLYGLRVILHTTQESP
jgi:hypothetical protein